MTALRQFGRQPDWISRRDRRGFVPRPARNRVGRYQRRWQWYYALIAHDATTNATPASNAASITFSHTVSGSDRVLVVKVQWRDVQAITVTTTYNAVAMTQLRVDSGDGAAGPFSTIFYLVAPDTGAHNVVVTFSNNVTHSFASASSYTGVDQTIPNDVAGGAGTFGTGTSQSHSITTVTDNAWVIDCLAAQDTSPTMVTAAGRTERQNQSNGSGRAASSDRGPITTAGSVTMDWTTGSSIKWAISLMALRPAAAPGKKKLSLVALLAQRQRRMAA